MSLIVVHGKIEKSVLSDSEYYEFVEWVRQHRAMLIKLFYGKITMGQFESYITNYSGRVQILKKTETSLPVDIWVDCDKYYEYLDYFEPVVFFNSNYKKNCILRTAISIRNLEIESENFHSLDLKDFNKLKKWITLNEVNLVKLANRKICLKEFVMEMKRT